MHVVFGVASAHPFTTIAYRLLTARTIPRCCERGSEAVSLPSRAYLVSLSLGQATGSADAPPRQHSSGYLTARKAETKAVAHQASANVDLDIQELGASRRIKQQKTMSTFFR